jgi:mRNA-degrading endonuclease toxin of MazEF toxin-antitoxin module
MEITKKLDALCISQNAYNAKRTDVIFVLVLTSVSFIPVHIF